MLSLDLSMIVLFSVYYFLIQFFFLKKKLFINRFDFVVSNAFEGLHFFRIYTTQQRCVAAVKCCPILPLFERSLIPTRLRVSVENWEPLKSVPGMLHCTISLSVLSTLNQTKSAVFMQFCFE
jgi:hypothetical protein